jgi:HlyD family secretion protein
MCEIMRHAVGLGLLVALAGCGSVESGAASDTTPGRSTPAGVTALGRLQPHGGIRRLAGPSRPSVVIARLLVEEGDRVEEGQAIAILDTQTENEARVARARAELVNAETELGRVEELFRQQIASVSLRDAAQLKVDVARTELQAAQSALDLDTVRSPVRGQVLKIHTRRGERVGPEGIAEVAETDRMYAVADVYETDIGRVRVGQRATIRSPALAPELGGTVERVGMKVGRLDELDTDPAARTDARVVEVEVRLDDSARAAGLSNLQVEVAIGTAPDPTKDL